MFCKQRILHFIFLLKLSCLLVNVLYVEKAQTFFVSIQLGIHISIEILHSLIQLKNCNKVKKQSSLCSILSRRNHSVFNNTIEKIGITIIVSL